MNSWRQFPPQGKGEWNLLPAKFSYLIKHNMLTGFSDTYMYTQSGQGGYFTANKPSSNSFPIDLCKNG